MPSLQLALLAEILLPFSCTLSLDDIRLTTTSLDLLVENQEPQAACPACGTLAYRIHSRYGRLLTDLLCCGRQLHLHGLFRRFFCDDPTCGKVTFAEQMPIIAQRYARKTQRLRERLRQIGFESGGEAGKRLSHLFDISISGDQMIRLVRTASEAG